MNERYEILSTPEALRDALGRVGKDVVRVEHNNYVHLVGWLPTVLSANDDDDEFISALSKMRYRAVLRAPEVGVAQATGKTPSELAAEVERLKAAGPSLELLKPAIPKGVTREIFAHENYYTKTQVHEIAASIRHELTVRAEAAEYWVRQLEDSLRAVLPYAEACVGSMWREQPPADSVIVAARAALGEGGAK